MPETTTNIQCDVQILRCNFNNEAHCKAIVALMRAYMLDKMGDANPLTHKQNEDLINGLRQCPTVLTLLAAYQGRYVGLTNSFVNFGTFAAKSFLNIHDVIVLPQTRGLGIGKKLLQENIRLAKDELGCAKITLEVRNDNTVAQQLYQSLGFGNCQPPMLFWTKKL